MNKIFPILLIYITTVNLQAQNGYIKFNKDKELQGIFFFKGEIYPLLKETNDNLPFYFKVNSDTINVGRSVDKVETEPADYTSSKDNFITSKAGNLIHIDLSSISNGADSIRLISEKFEVIPIIKKTSKDFEAAKIGKLFHLIIPNSPTIYYSLDNLAKFKDKSENLKGEIVFDNKFPKKKNALENELSSIISSIKEKAEPLSKIFLLSILGVGIIGFGIWLFLRRKNNPSGSDKEPIYITYTGDKSLSSFAMDNHIKLEALIRYNKGVIDKKYTRFNYKERKDIQNNLKNRKLIVGFQEIGVANSNNNYTENEPIIEPPKIEKSLINDIQQVNSDNNNLTDLKRLKNEKTEIENRLRAFETEKLKLDSTIKQLNEEKAAFENNLKTAMAEANHVQNELKELKEKLMKLNI